jgi:hypothetical protein
MLYDDLKSKLLTMAERDLQVRDELAASGELFGGYHRQMAAVHSENAEALDRIIEEFGWPGVSMVGNDGAEAAWLVLQHAIGSPAFQRKCLPIFKAAVEAGEAAADQLACLEDRICVFEGRPQRYGTQFDWDGDGNLSPYPVEDPERVDHYRESVGLERLTVKTQEMRRRAAAEGHEQPADSRQYLNAREAWARSVGWR